MKADIQRIAAWLQPKDILLDVHARDRSQAFEVASSGIALLHGLNPAVIHRALLRREQIGSTGLGNGFAIPHAGVEGIKQPVTLFMRTRAPIEFAAKDGKPVSELLFIMAPTDGVPNDHLQLLALVAQLFSDTEFRQELKAQTHAAGAAAAFETGIARVVASA
ncbi:MAG: PTS sugar transporter subunit IIA [Burkholderiaceae bacterium]|nr:PTS sugar transporter subunit IIA [Roseateles sp.]MBV8470037.1 PTS sugar transporter subunit IIA [Burkholderiaceae bacterium]